MSATSSPVGPLQGPLNALGTAGFRVGLKTVYGPGQPLFRGVRAWLCTWTSQGHQWQADAPTLDALADRVTRWLEDVDAHMRGGAGVPLPYGVIRVDRREQTS